MRIRDGEIIFGSVYSRELCIRWHMPFQFVTWCDGTFRFSWRRFFNPVVWWRNVFRKSSWDLWWRYYRDGSHRCYCPTGSMFDGNVTVAGFGLGWFYSNFTGQNPCPCDMAMAETFGCSDCGELAPIVPGTTQCQACHDWTPETANEH